MMRQYKPGDEVVAGVKIIAPIGAGGFGMVYKVSVSGGVEKALKIINLQGTQGIKEFNALRLIKKISHPNLVEIDSYWLRDMQGKLINFDSDDSINAEKQALELIILMSLGRMSLLDLLNQYRKQGKPGIPYPELIELMTDTAKAIDFLNSPHDLGLKEPVCVQHGDIKPGNILIKGNSVQVCDYGLAKAITKGPRTSVALFSPAYCSPEANNNKPSNWSDQFSLAISYYELRTGKLPFNEEDAMNAGIEAVLGKLDFTLLPRLEQEVLQKATDPVPHQRFPKCIDFVNALRSTQGNIRDSGYKPRTLEEILQPDSEIVSGYKLLHRLNFSERDEFWKAVTPASKQFIIHVIREFKGSLGNQLVQALETLRQMDEHDNLINLRNCWTLHTNGRAVPYVDPSSLGDDTVALVTLLDNVECTLEDYYNECLKKKHPGIPDHELMQFMSQTARGVDYLTQVGYAEFLDLKPQTILLTKNKSVKIGITGLAKRLMAGSTTLTTDRLVNAFAPPELFDFAIGKHWNSNQYSLALTYYWLRSRGQLPFPANSSPKQIREYHLHGQLDFSAVSEREQTILYNATVQDPNHRFESCDAFVEALSIAVGYSIPAGVSARHPGSDHGIDRQTPQPEPDEPQQSLPERPTPSTGPGRTTPQNMPQAAGTLEWDKLDFERIYGAGLTGPRSGGPKVLQPVVRPATPQEPAPPPYTRPVDSHVSNEPRSFFEEARLRRKKRQRVAIITSLVGLLVVAVTVGLVAYKFISPSGLVETKPEQHTQQLAQAREKVDKALEKNEFIEALDIVNEQTDKTWKDDETKRIRDKLHSWLDIQMTEKNKGTIKLAEDELQTLTHKYKIIISQDWIDKWNGKIGDRKTSITSLWSTSWSNIEGELNTVTEKSVSDLIDKAKAAKIDAPNEKKQDVDALIKSLETLKALNEKNIEADRAGLEDFLEKFHGSTKRSALKESPFFKEIRKKILNKIPALVNNAGDPDVMKENKKVLLLTEQVDPTPSGSVYGGLLEIASISNSKLDSSVSNWIKETKDSQSMYARYAYARWHVKTDPIAALTVLDEGIKSKLNMKNVALAQKWRRDWIVKELDNIITNGIDQKYISKQGKLPEVQTALRILNEWPDLPPEDKSRYKALALLLNTESEAGKKALADYQKGKEFEKLEDQKLAEAIIEKLNLGTSKLPTPLARRIAPARELLNKYLDEGDVNVTPAQLLDAIIIPLTDPKQLEEINKLPDNEKKQLASVLSDLGEDMIFEKEKWNELIEAKGLSPDTTKNLHRIATQQFPSNHEFRLRYILSQYVKSNDALIKEWEAYATTAKKESPDYFGSYLLGGISSYMQAIHSENDADKVPTRIQELKQADADYTKALKLLDKKKRYFEHYQLLITLDRSSIALQLANLHYARNDQEKYLKDALQLAEDSKSLDRKLGKKDPDTCDNLGVILEDRGMLLGLTGEYEKAIKEYNEAVDNPGKFLRNKPLLHRGRCYLRWGEASGNPVYYDFAEQNLKSFLRGSEPVRYQIEANYFLALLHFAKAEKITSHRPEWYKENNEGIRYLKVAKELGDSKGVSLWKRKINFRIVDKSLAIARSIIQLDKPPKYSKYSIDPNYKEMIRNLENVKNSLQENDPNDPFGNYIAGRIVDMQDENADNGAKLAKAFFDKSIQEFSKQDHPDPVLLSMALDSRADKLFEDELFSDAYDDVNKAYITSVKFNLKPTLQYRYTFRARQFSFYAYTKGNKGERYWVAARDHACNALKHYAHLVLVRDENDYLTFFQNLFRNVPANSAEKHVSETLEQLRIIAQNADQSVKPKLNGFHDKIKASAAQLK
ncbi:MAG: protein kinase [Planctomycetia bacterium]|nr:protein kinase [Planctomycetia bacterium]